MTTSETRYEPTHSVRFVTAASLFDGHDASINIIRRLLQARGVEVIHLGHNRSVSEIVDAVIEEDAQAVAVSSYQGGHNEYFRYLVDRLRERGARHVKVFGGGGGVIIPSEIRALEAYGVTKIYSPEDGLSLGLAGIIDHMVREADFALAPVSENGDLSWLKAGEVGKLARLITQAELDESGLGAELDKTSREARGGAESARPWHHGHRRRREELFDGRDRKAARRGRARASDRSRVGRPVEAKDGRCASR